jgi:hypothetical protein
MTTCPTKLASLSCSQTGVGNLAIPAITGATTLTMFIGMGVNFPTPTTGQSFFVELGSVCDGYCTRVEIVKRVEDTLHLARPLAIPIACIGATAKIKYAYNCEEHIALVVRSLGLNVMPPLRFNCETRTLSINCEELKQMVNQPCGT